MTPDIQAIFLDVGDTLRILHLDEAYQSAARRKIAKLVGTADDPDDFCTELNNRYAEYRKWAFEQMAEASEVELWTRWMAPEYPLEQIKVNAIELSFQYRQTKGRRIFADDGRQVIAELHRRGYILGIISNLITSQELPDWLEEEQLTGYFKAVALSSQLGIRKPAPEIYHYAARQAGVAPAHCAYVGDNLKRDITGTRAAGFGMAIILLLNPSVAVEPLEPHNQPDLIIHSLSDLLEIFP